MIKILAPADISQIAAGEVVERPASVVKELLENALDAGATQISLELKAGGTSLIRISDNGCGIASAEAELAFERHATSKIGGFEDLQKLTTLGFRGEALPSIAAVARVQLLTCARSESAASYLVLENGKLLRRETQARPLGTTVTVENLFRSFPARLKFLKSPAAESSRIAALLSHYALAWPEVKFSLTLDGKAGLQTPGSGKMLDALIAVYGLDTARNMLAVEGGPPIAVSGLAGSPAVTRASRDYLSFFVNRRWINNRMLSFAVEEAYHGLLMQGKHPLAVIDLTLPPEVIDVNVHPAKTEIKFADERAVFSAVQRAVRQALVHSSPVPRVDESPSHFSTPSTAYFNTPASGTPSSRALPASQPPGQPDSPPAPVPLLTLPLLRVLGQLAATYIVAEGPEGLFLIDQHAAHERILFEKISAQRQAVKPEVQGFLQPAAFEIEPARSELLRLHLPQLAEIGFEIEPFGAGTFLVRSIPALLRDRDWQSVLREVLVKNGFDWQEELTATLACHSAIRAGQILDPAEMRQLIAQLEVTALPNSCPHGRPTMLQISLQRLEKDFGRLQ